MIASLVTESPLLVCFFSSEPKCCLESRGEYGGLLADHSQFCRPFACIAPQTWDERYRSNAAANIVHNFDLKSSVDPVFVLVHGRNRFRIESVFDFVERLGTDIGFERIRLLLAPMGRRFVGEILRSHRSLSACKTQDLEAFVKERGETRN